MVLFFANGFVPPPVAESLALLLRNQHDRFMLAFYDSYDHVHPHRQSTHQLIWRTIILHIAHNDQRVDYNEWQLVFWENDRAETGQPHIPTHIDDIVLMILSGFPIRAFFAVPTTAVYATHDATTYDTLQHTFIHREYLMTPSRSHQPFASVQDNRSDMLQLQLPVPSPLPQVPPLDHNYLRFQLTQSLDPLEVAEL